MIGDQGDLIPDLAEPITGWRAWHVSNDDPSFPLLLSFNGATWPPVGEKRRRGSKDHLGAICQLSHAPCQEPPSPTGEGHVGLGCGIYAFKDPVDMVAELLPHIFGSPKETVLGKVSMWGKVYPHERGYRSQYARLESLAYINGSGVFALMSMPPEEVRRIASNYGISAEGLDVSAEELSEAMTSSQSRWLASTPTPLRIDWRLSFKMAFDILRDSIIPRRHHG